MIPRSILRLPSGFLSGKVFRVPRLVRSLSDNPVALAFDDYGAGPAALALENHGAASPLVISHGMLGSRANWTSLAKQINKKTGRRVITVDARNHGDSPHTSDMNYSNMAGDLERLILDLGLETVSIMGHSMGGRTSMTLALENSGNIIIDKLVVVDVSPVNPVFDTMSGNEWNMEHFFHSLKAVSLTPGLPLSAARKEADSQLATRISNPGLRAWLLMNLKLDTETGMVVWKINTDTIHQAFREHIAVFPDLPYSFDLPTLFIGGADSDYIPVTDHEQILEQFPSARFEYVASAGHWVHSEKPAEFLEVLLKFL